METFTTFWKSLDAKGRVEFAASAGTSIPHLCQVASGHRNLGSNLFFRLLEADKRVTHEMLRPHVKTISRAKNAA